MQWQLFKKIKKIQNHFLRTQFNLIRRKFFFSLRGNLFSHLVYTHIYLALELMYQ